MFYRSQPKLALPMCSGLFLTLTILVAMAIPASAEKEPFPQFGIMKDGSGFTKDLLTMITGQPFSNLSFKTKIGNDEIEWLLITKYDGGQKGIPQLFQKISITPLGEAEMVQRNDLFPLGKGPKTGSRGASAADFDKDGDDDFFLCNALGRSQLFANNLADPNPYHRKFGDVTTSVFSAQDLPYLENAYVATWEDYDQDGWVDLYVYTLCGNQILFHNSFGKLVRITPTVQSSQSASAVSWQNSNRHFESEFQRSP